MTLWDFMKLELDAWIVTLPFQILVFGLIAFVMHRAQKRWNKQ